MSSLYNAMPGLIWIVFALAMFLANSDPFLLLYGEMYDKEVDPENKKGN